MTIAEIIAARQIDEVVHFTTNHGCLGSLYTGSLQSRARLEGDEMVEYLFKPNARLRRDPGYLDHVSLSIGHINTQYFGTSARSWHRDEPIFWCILAFDPVILEHPNVVFSTTNNIYTSVQRGMGEQGFDRLFADRTVRWQGNIAGRQPAWPSHYPTCFQAEALYPQSVSTEFLQRIYVQTSADQSEVIGFLKATFHRDIAVLVEPQKFEPRP
ncbi:MAG: DarT ssDNA thymidine ADP-ribosyltransferase family protein [Pseudomonadota bacterium]